jgi:hypothetical protein
MKLLSTVCTAAILAATYNNSVSALEGQLAEKQFPFVLQFYAWYEKPEKKGSACTATVIEPRLLVTAAHCVTKPYAGKTPESFVSNVSSSVWINLQEGDLPKDNPTRQKLINAGMLIKIKSVFVTKTFEYNYYHTQRLRSLVKAETEKEKAEGRTQTPETKKLRDDFIKFRDEQVLIDIAYLVPTKPIYLPSYPKWVLNDFPQIVSSQWSISPSNIPELESKFDELYGRPLNGTVVGLGTKDCEGRDKGKDWTNNKWGSCTTTDHKKRWAVVPFVFQNRNMLSDGVSVPNRPPWIWSLGPSEGLTISVHAGGDSGGPLFIKNKNNELMLVGISSGSSASQSRHSSPIFSPALYWMAINSKDYKNLSVKSKHQ